MAVAQVKEVSYTLLQARDEGEDTRGNALCRTPYDIVSSGRSNKAPA